MKMKTKKLLNILLSPKGFSVFALSLLVSTLVLALTSGLILFPYFELNPFADPSIILIIGLISIFFSLNAAVVVHSISNSSFFVSKSGFAGAFAGLLTTTCPVCAPVFFSWLGFGSYFLFLSNFNFYIGILSIMLLIYSLWNILDDNSCKVNINGKRN